MYSPIVVHQQIIVKCLIYLGRVYSCMKSQELKQIHALLYEVRKHLANEGDVPPGAFVNYDSQPIRPSHVHHSKNAHKNGISLILTGIEYTLRSNPPPETDAVLTAQQ